MLAVVARLPRAVRLPVTLVGMAGESLRSPTGSEMAGGELWHSLASPEADDSVLFHYTSLDTSLKILESGRLRLSPYMSTNDPRETKEWVAEVTLAAGGVSTAALEDADAAGKRADQLLRRGVRLACFTVDRHQRPEAPADALFHRGLARPNMWAHYADRHAGVCLVFRRHSLVEQVDGHRPLEEGDVFSCGAVEYRDTPLSIHVAMEDVLERGIEDVLDDFQTRQGVVSHLYFTKNSDWAAEQEFRIVVVRWNTPQEEWDVPLDIPIASCLIGIVVGDASPDDQVAALRKVGAVAGVRMAHCGWDRGAPTISIR